MADIRIFDSKSGAAKIAALICLIVSMATFFSLHIPTEAEKSAIYFVTSMIVSPFLHTTFLLIVYVFGGLAIQKTLYEFLVNSFYTLMLTIAAIVLFTMTTDDSGTIASGIFLLLAATCYGIDTYLALVNTGAFDTAAAADVQPPPPAAPHGVNRSQPFTPPQPYIPPQPYGSPEGLAAQSPYPVTNHGSFDNTGDLGNRI